MIYITGFLMALADSVPGVSGGTIAFILGQYEKFISSISGLMDRDTRMASINYLVRFGLAWACGLMFSIFTIASLMETHIYEITSMFLAFVFFAIFLIIAQEKKDMQDNKFLVYTFIGMIAVVAVSLVGLKLDVAASTSFDNISLATYFYIFISGIVAISAMLLPGMSGSTVLLIFGLYYLVIGTIKEVLTFDFSNILILVVFGLGVLVGVFLSTKVISNLLKTHYSEMLYLIIGLMIGSLFSIITGPMTQVAENGLKYDALGFDTFSVIFFVIGGLVIYSLNILKCKSHQI